MCVARVQVGAEVGLVSAGARRGGRLRVPDSGCARRRLCRLALARGARGGGGGAGAPAAADTRVGDLIASPRPVGAGREGGVDGRAGPGRETRAVSRDEPRPVHVPSRSVQPGPPTQGPTVTVGQKTTSSLAGNSGPFHAGQSLSNSDPYLAGRTLRLRVSSLLDHALTRGVFTPFFPALGGRARGLNVGLFDSGPVRRLVPGPRRGSGRGGGVGARP